MNRLEIYPFAMPLCLQLCTNFSKLQLQRMQISNRSSESISRTCTIQPVKQIYYFTLLVKSVQNPLAEGLLPPFNHYYWKENGRSLIMVLFSL